MNYDYYRNQMKNVLNNHPNLCDHGWRTRSVTDEKFQKERDKMLTNDALDQFKSACEWVRLMQPNCRFNMSQKNVKKYDVYYCG
jgi:hypothetical protein